MELKPRFFGYIILYCTRNFGNLCFAIQCRTAGQHNSSRPSPFMHSVYGTVIRSDEGSQRYAKLLNSDNKQLFSAVEVASGGYLPCREAAR